jgi:hypothetical protein
MYNDLGQYRIVEHKKKFHLEKFSYGSWTEVDSFWYRGKSVEELQKKIFEFRYSKAKFFTYWKIKLKKARPSKVVYSHP